MKPGMERLAELDVPTQALLRSNPTAAAFRLRLG